MWNVYVSQLHSQRISLYNYFLAVSARHLKDENVFGSGNAFYGILMKESDFKSQTCIGLSLKQRTK